MGLRIGQLKMKTVRIMILLGVISGYLIRLESFGEKVKDEGAPPDPGLSLQDRFAYTSYSQGFQNAWAPRHISPSLDHRSVSLTLDRFSGTGIRSKEAYLYGFFSATIKLPDNFYSAGVVTTFYVSNAELYPGDHDEVDFEFLGRAHGERYVLQTNMYMRGNTGIGREQRLHLWFDPSIDAHSYSILWTPHHIVHFVDNVPIRELSNHKLQATYPSRPLHVYGTIWDGSSWATNGGKYKVDYAYSPFMATYSNFILSGCIATSNVDLHKCSSNRSTVSRLTGNLPQQLSEIEVESMHWVHRHYMTYDYCEDYERYPTPLVECQQSRHSTKVNEGEL